MGLIVGLLIGLFCRTFRTAAMICLAPAVLFAAFLSIGAAQDPSMEIGPKLGIIVGGAVVVYLFLTAGAFGVVAIKKWRRKPKETVDTSVFGPRSGEPEAARPEPARAATIETAKL